MINIQMYMLIPPKDAWPVNEAPGLSISLWRMVEHKLTINAHFPAMWRPYVEIIA